MNDNNPQRPAARRQFFDVVRPGRTPASPTSRPVLPSNQPPVPDGSMKPSAPAVPAKIAPIVSAPQPPAAPPAPPRPPIAPAAQASVMPPRPAPQSVQSVSAPQHTAPVAPIPAPALIDPPASAQVTEPQQTRAHHRHSLWSEVLAIAAIILLIAIILNILADADIINLPIPHTNFFDY